MLYEGLIVAKLFLILTWGFGVLVLIAKGLSLTILSILGEKIACYLCELFELSFKSKVGGSSLVGLFINS